MKNTIKMKNENRKVECCTCGLVHRISDRIKQKVESFTGNYCPTCSDESYYDDLKEEFKNSETLKQETKPSIRG